MLFLLDLTALGLFLEESLDWEYCWRDLLDRLLALGLMVTLAWWLYSWRYGWQWSQFQVAAVGLVQAAYFHERLQGTRLAPGWLLLYTWGFHAGRWLLA